MSKSVHRNGVIAFVLGVVALLMAGLANADPPSRVARLGYMTGTVSFSPAGEDDWVQATMNRPLVTGDRLWADTGARTELQIGAAVVRMGSATSLTLLNIDDRVTQLQLAQGSLSVRVRRVAANEVFEIDTPNVAFSIRRPGEYRIDVDAAGSATIVAVRNGQADVYGEGASYVVNTRQAYRFAGTGLRDYERFDTLPLDEFDRWATERDRRWDRSVSARYVSPEVIGYQDLDSYGTWRSAPGYGNVWVPSRVSADWAPYRDGHWTWVDPWGWTWVDDEPWGFAVSHYGRWANLGGGWGWVPGPIAARPVYAPALVAFVGGSNFQIGASGGGIGWFPLAPREVYRPAYSASRRYFNDVNASNTVINNTVINNYYNNPNAANVTYANRQVPGAIVAVPTATFVQAQPVSRAAVRVSREMIANAPVTSVAAVAPQRASLIGSAKPAGKPSAAIFERPVIARTAPPPRPAGFAPREQLLAKNPGKPLEPAAVSSLPPHAGPAGKIQVVTPSQTPAPTSAPPMRRAQADKPGKERFQQPSEVAQPSVSQPPTAGQPPVVVAPGKMASQPPPIGPGPLRGRPATLDSQAREPHGKPDKQGVPTTPPPSAAAPAAAPPQPLRGKPEPAQRQVQAPPPAPAAPPVAVAPAPAAAPPEPPRGKPEKPTRREVQAPPPAPAAPPVAVAPAPAAAPPEPPRGKPEKPARREVQAPSAPQPAAAPPPPPQARPAPPPPPAARMPAAAPSPPPQPQAQPRGPEPKPEGGKQGGKPQEDKGKPHEDKGGDDDKKPKK